MTARHRLYPYTGQETRKRRITRLTTDNQTTIAYSPEEFITVAEAANFAKCSEQKIRNLYEKHPIAKIVFGKVLVSRSDLLVAMANEANNANDIAGEID